MKRLNILLSIVLILFLSTGCNKNKESIIYETYNGITYIINDKDNKLPFLFASLDNINSIDIISINGEIIYKNKINYEFIIEKDAKGNKLKYKDYYLYGIIIEIVDEIDYIDTVEFKINTDSGDYINPFKFDIYTKNSEEFEAHNIVPLNIPIDYSINSPYKLELLAKEELTIHSVDLISSTMQIQSIKINSMDYQNNNNLIKFLENDQINISIILQNKEGYSELSFDKVMIKITYSIDGESYYYITPYTIFGKLEETIKNRIDEVGN